MARVRGKATISIVTRRINETINSLYLSNGEVSNRKKMDTFFLSNYKKVEINESKCYKKSLFFLDFLLQKKNV